MLDRSRCRLDAIGLGVNHDFYMNIRHYTHIDGIVRLSLVAEHAGSIIYALRSMLCHPAAALTNFMYGLQRLTFEIGGYFEPCREFGEPKETFLELLADFLDMFMPSGTHIDVQAPMVSWDIWVYSKALALRLHDLAQNGFFVTINGIEVHKTFETKWCNDAL